MASIKGFADFEQLKGGVEKLFGTSAKTISNYARNAYKTSGLTANQYMETVTGFSAGLIASMGGDTAAAAEIANMAINDMADNASVFGTSMDDIQHAYQGFAKANYTMLDNLKLGYGGTRGEMERLLEDAEKISGIHYDISSLDDVYSAIHVVQEEMKITGNASAEASKTISGSINSAKSAWSNLITGLADDSANIPELVSNVVETTTQVIANLKPIIKQVIESLPEALREVCPEVADAFEGVINIVVPILSKLKDIVVAVIGFVVEHWDLISTIGEILLAIGAAIAVVNTALSVANAVMGAISLFTSPIGLVIAGITALIVVIVECVKHWDEIKEKVKEVVDKIVGFVGDMVEKVKNFFGGMKEKVVNKVEDIKGNMSEKWEDIKNTVGEKVSTLKDNVVDKWENIKGKVGEKVDTLKSNLGEKWEGIKQGATDTATNIKNNMGDGWENIGNTIGEKVHSMKDNVSENWTNLKEKLGSTTDGMKEKLVSQFTGMKENITSKVDSMADRIRSKFDNIKSSITEKINSAKNAVSSAVDRIRSVMNFSWHLPHLSLPHISISGHFSLRPPSVPHFGISWYEKGGIFDSPTLFGYGNGALGGLGENGAEAIVPLENNTEWLDRIAERLASKMGSTPIVLEVDGKVFAETSISCINELTRQTGRLAINVI